MRVSSSKLIKIEFESFRANVSDISPLHQRLAVKGFTFVGNHVINQTAPFDTLMPAGRGVAIAQNIAGLSGGRGVGVSGWASECPKLPTKSVITI